MDVPKGPAPNWDTARIRTRRAAAVPSELLADREVLEGLAVAHGAPAVMRCATPRAVAASASAARGGGVTVIALHRKPWCI
jgi:hypothetical protein